MDIIDDQSGYVIFGLVLPHKFRLRERISLSLSLSLSLFCCNRFQDAIYSGTTLKLNLRVGQRHSTRDKNRQEKLYKDNLLLPPHYILITHYSVTYNLGHCWRSRDELISDVLLWTPTYGRAKAGRPARTYIQQLCEDTGWTPEDMPEAMNDREKWRERVRDIRASGTK